MRKLIWGIMLLIILPSISCQQKPVEDKPCVIEGELCNIVTGHSIVSARKFIDSKHGFTIECSKGVITRPDNACVIIDSDAVLKIQELSSGKTALFVQGSAKRVESIIEGSQPRKTRTSDIKWLKLLLSGSPFAFIDEDDRKQQREMAQQQKNLIASMMRVLKAEQHYGNASLTSVNGIPLLRLSGTPEEIGTQYGTILKDILKDIPAYLKFSGVMAEENRDNMSRLANRIGSYLPPDIRTEMRAIARASGIDYETLLVINTLSDFYDMFCSTAVALEPKSAEGGPIFGRNIDTFGRLNLPPDFQLVVVYHIKGKKSFVSVTFPGIVGCLSGMNEDGLSLGNMLISNAKDKPVYQGVPSPIIYRQMLENAADVDEAGKILEKTQRIAPWNLMLCDARTAKVAEYSAGKICYRTPAQNVLYATNHFRTAEMRGNEVSNDGRYLQLEQSLSAPDLRLDIEGMKSIMKSVAPGESNIQCVIFLPAKQFLYVSIGKPPAAAGTFSLFDNEMLFKKK